VNSKRLTRVFKSRTLLVAIVVVGVLLTAALWPTSVAVDTAKITRGRLEVTVDEEGETRVRDRFVVSAPVSGRVLRIELEPGDRVKKGRPIATIAPAASTPLDPRTRAEASARVQASQAAVGRARAEVQRARAALELALAEAERARDLGELISRQERDQRESQARVAEEELKASEFALRTAEEEVRIARAQLIADGAVASGDPVTVGAPVDGVVLKRVRESESVVSAGEPLLEIGNRTQLEIVSDLLSTDAVRVKAGDSVRIEQWGGERALAGRVRRVEPSGFTKISALGVEEQRVNAVIDFEDPVAASSALGDGYRVEVRIVIWQKDGVLKAPTSSLFRRGDGFAVFVVDDGKARVQPVQVGQRNGLEAEIVSGLDEGTVVVVHPPDTLANGTRLTVRES
jgi:HlyD family secretion protein